MVCLEFYVNSSVLFAEPIFTTKEVGIARDVRESSVPETDYSVFDKIPVTSFTCVDRIDGKTKYCNKISIFVFLKLCWYSIYYPLLFRLLRWHRDSMPSVPYLLPAAGAWSYKDFVPLSQWNHLQSKYFCLSMVCYSLKTSHINYASIIYGTL